MSDELEKLNVEYAIEYSTLQAKHKKELKELREKYSSVDTSVIEIACDSISSNNRRLRRNRCYSKRSIQKNVKR